MRAVVVLRDGHAAGDALARELQDHVKAETAPYKYPRIVEFADALPQDARAARSGAPSCARTGPGSDLDAGITAPVKGPGTSSTRSS